MIVGTDWKRERLNRECHIIGKVANRNAGLTTVVSDKFGDLWQSARVRILTDHHLMELVQQLTTTVVHGVERAGEDRAEELVAEAVATLCSRLSDEDLVVFEQNTHFLMRELIDRLEKDIERRESRFTPWSSDLD